MRKIPTMLTLIPFKSYDLAKATQHFRQAPPPPTITNPSIRDCRSQHDETEGAYPQQVSGYRYIRMYGNITYFNEI